MRLQRAVPSLVGTAAMVVGFLEAARSVLSPAGALLSAVLLFLGGAVVYPDTRALAEAAAGREFGPRAVAAAFVGALVLSAVALGVP